MTAQLILASSSPYRAALLSKLGLTFQQQSPQIDETPHPDEAPGDLIARLAEAKARAVAARFPQALIIASDQMAVLNGRILGKPGHHEAAVEQLRKASGKEVEFLTSLALLNGATDRLQLEIESFVVGFRELSDAQIENYLRLEHPYDCAGSFKSEGLGIALFDWLRGDDPNTLIGLPLIRLVRLLEHEGIFVI